MPADEWVSLQWQKAERLRQAYAAADCIASVHARHHAAQEGGEALRPTVTYLSRDGAPCARIDYILHREGHNPTFRSLVVTLEALGL